MSHPHAKEDGSPYVMPSFLLLMVAIATMFYVSEARDDIDRYPACFIRDCAVR